MVEKKEDSIAYFNISEPTKVVVILDIHEVVDPLGFLKYEYRGFDGWWQYGPEEIN